MGRTKYTDESLSGLSSRLPGSLHSKTPVKPERPKKPESFCLQELFFAVHPYHHPMVLMSSSAFAVDADEAVSRIQKPMKASRI